MMGTSTGYGAPKTPQWAAVKGLVTKNAPDGKPSRLVAQQTVRDFIGAFGDRRQYTRGGGSIGQTRSAQRVAANVGRFLSTVAADGLPSALREFGLESLTGRPVIEVLDALVDALGGPADTLDDVDARNALSDLRDDILAPAETLEELEEVLAERAAPERVLDLLVQYFGLVLYHQFCRVFYERLVEKVGDRQAQAYLGGIRDFLISSARDHHLHRDLREVDWAGAEGQRISNELLEQTLYVFAGE